MRRKIIILSVFAAAIGSMAFTDRGLWLPALACIGWELLVLYASTRKKPRAATRSNENRSSTKILDFYSTTVTINTQAKTWTPAGKAVIPMHYSE